MLSKEIANFQQTVWEYYDQHGRHDLPWRLPEVDGSFDAYKILVSEVMLQQTQVSRVIPKYARFLELFPRVEDLARASLGDVLVTWQGLGYNRRAKFLWQAAQMVVNEYGGEFPHDQQELTKLPGVGVNTAGAVVAYTHNQPVVFIETNIRTVFIHHFFSDKADEKGGVHDKAVAELVRASLPQGKGANIRLWYWALMDYGTYVKQMAGNKSRASKSYAKQSPFAGSRRAVRGAVIRYLSKNEQGSTKSGIGREGLAGEIIDPRLPEVLQDLVKEGLLQEHGGQYWLA
jgi:A/G-specific adenine glycosylase